MNNYRLTWSFNWFCSESVPADYLIPFCFVESNLKSRFYALNTHQPVVQSGFRGNSQCGRGGQPGMKHLLEELYKMVCPHENALELAAD